MALYEIDVIDSRERDQLQQYSEFVNCVYTGTYLVTVRSIHHEPHCPYRPLAQPEQTEPIGVLLRCSIMPNGVHAHLYISDSKERYLRFVEVSESENLQLLDAYY